MLNVSLLVKASAAIVVSALDRIVPVERGEAELLEVFEDSPDVLVSAECVPSLE